jgi:hypothetical protein
MSYISFLMARQPLLDQRRLPVEASRSHSDTQHWVGFLWTSDRFVAETSKWQYNTHMRYSCSVGIGTCSPSNRAAVDAHVRLRGRKIGNILCYINIFCVNKTCQFSLYLYFQSAINTNSS